MQNKQCKTNCISLLSLTLNFYFISFPYKATSVSLGLSEMLWVQGRSSNEQLTVNKGVLIIMRCSGPALSQGCDTPSLNMQTTDRIPSVGVGLYRFRLPAGRFTAWWPTFQLQTGNQSYSPFISVPMKSEIIPLHEKTSPI